MGANVLPGFLHPAIAADASIQHFKIRSAQTVTGLSYAKFHMTHFGISALLLPVGYFADHVPAVPEDTLFSRFRFLMPQQPSMHSNSAAAVSTSVPANNYRPLQNPPVSPRINPFALLQHGPEHLATAVLRRRREEGTISQNCGCQSPENPDWFPDHVPEDLNAHLPVDALLLDFPDLHEYLSS